MTFTATDVLLKAASRIEEEGMWCQFRMWQGQAGCALGTLLHVADELDTRPDEAIDRLDNFLGYSLVEWNDAPGRTAHEVAEAMRRAAL